MVRQWELVAHFVAAAAKTRTISETTSQHGLMSLMNLVVPTELTSVMQMGQTNPLIRRTQELPDRRRWLTSVRHSGCCSTRGREVGGAMAREEAAVPEAGAVAVRPVVQPDL